MAAHIKLKATFLVTLLLAAEAHRVLQVTSIHDLSSSSNAQNSRTFVARKQESLRQSRISSLLQETQGAHANLTSAASAAAAAAETQQAQVGDLTGEESHADKLEGELATLRHSMQGENAEEAQMAKSLAMLRSAKDSAMQTAVITRTSLSNQNPFVIGAYTLAMCSGFFIAPATAVAAPAAAVVKGPAAWKAVLAAAASLKGVGLLAKPIITKIASRKAGEVVVVAATRPGLIQQAALKLFPWAFTATPGVGQAFLAAQIFVTGWQLFQLQGILRDPKELCDLLSKIPGSPLSRRCAPTGRWGSLIPPPGPPPTDVPPGLSELVQPEVAAAVLTMLVIAGGGAWAWHLHSQRAAYDQAFCPRSTWEIDPQFIDELPGRVSVESDAEVGMAQCHGYYYKAVPVDCALDDLPCRHLACQQACCDHKDCVAYQFTNQKSMLNFTSGMGCYLTTKRVQESDCEVRWFGEIRSNFEPELNETIFTLTGMWDPDPEGLREERWTAVAKLGHRVFGLKKVQPLPAAEVCDSAVNETGKGTSMSVARRMREQCERDQCREACVATRHCIFYQYQRKTNVDWKVSIDLNEGTTFYEGWHGVDYCHLGISKELKSLRERFTDLGITLGFTRIDDKIYMRSHPWKQLKHFRTTEWYGGQRYVATVSRNGCRLGFACPRNGECVASCRDCVGFSLPGEQGACERAAHQAICDPSSWVDEYNGMKLNEMVCSGLTATGLITTDPTGLINTTVKLDEDVEMNGHDLCREACCAEPQCKLYQVHQKHADTKKYKKGDNMICYLGMLDSQQAPKFKCVPGTSYEGGYLFSRGCPEQTLACPVTNDCVASCDQCSGVSYVDVSGLSCTSVPFENLSKEGEQEINKRKDGVTDDWSKDDADPTPEARGEVQGPKDELEDGDYGLDPLSQSGDCLHPPCLDFTEDSGPTFYLTDLTDASNSPSWTMAASAETVVKIAEYKDKIVSPQDVASICALTGFKMQFNGFWHCEGTADMSGCRCSFTGLKKQACIPESFSRTPSFFQGSKHLIPIFTAKGMVLFSGSGCVCEERPAKSDLHWCVFKMMGQLPKLKLTAADPFALTL